MGWAMEMEIGNGYWKGEIFLFYVLLHYKMIADISEIIIAQCFPIWSSGTDKLSTLLDSPIRAA